MISGRDVTFPGSHRDQENSQLNSKKTLRTRRQLNG